MGASKSKTYREEDDVRWAELHDLSLGVISYIAANRERMEIILKHQKWWSNRLLHRASRVRRKFNDVELLLQNLGRREDVVEPSMGGHQTRIQRISYKLWSDEGTLKRLEMHANSLEARFDEFLGLFQEEKLLQAP